MVSSHMPAARPADDTTALWLGLAMVAVLVLFGGASRADALSQPVVRIASIAVCCACLLRARPSEFWRSAVMLRLLASFAALCLLQLVPLPPGLWASLPGRDQFAMALADAGFLPVWRPWSLAPDRTINALFACLPPLATLLVLAPLAKRHLDRVPLILLVIVAFSALLGLMQAYGGWPYPYRVTNTGNAVGIFANRNHSALLLAMGFPLVAYAALSARAVAGSRAVIVAGSAAAAAVLIALLITNGSRGGMVVGLVGLAGSAIMVWRSVGRTLDRKVLWVGLVCACALLVALGVAFWYSGRSLTLFRIAEGASQTEELRVLAFPLIVQLIAAYFPLGAGFGSFEAVYKVIEPDSLVTPVYLNHAHNDFLEIGVDAGLPGFILLALLLIRLTKGAIAKLSLRGDNVMALMAIVMLTQLAIGSALDYPVRTPFMAALFCYVAFVLISPSEEDVAGSGRAAPTKPKR